MSGGSTKEHLQSVLGALPSTPEPPPPVASTSTLRHLSCSSLSASPDKEGPREFLWKVRDIQWERDGIWR